MVLCWLLLKRKVLFDVVGVGVGMGVGVLGLGLGVRFFRVVLNRFVSVMGLWCGVVLFMVMV